MKRINDDTPLGYIEGRACLNGEPFTGIACWVDEEDRGRDDVYSWYSNWPQARVVLLGRAEV